MKHTFPLSHLKKPEIAAFCRRHNVRHAYLTGSYARQTAHKESDIDLIIEADSYLSLFDIGAIKSYLENTLGKKVDIVEKKAIRKDIKTSLLQNMYPVF